MIERSFIISSYSRKQAIADGVLIDISETAKELGFKFPIAMTEASYQDCVAWSENDNERTGTINDEAGRLWDVLWMLKFAIATNRNTDQINFELLRISKDGNTPKPETAKLKALCGPGDDMEPVITIMLPHED